MCTGVQCLQRTKTNDLRGNSQNTAPCRFLPKHSLHAVRLNLLNCTRSFLVANGISTTGIHSQNVRMSVIGWIEMPKKREICRLPKVGGRPVRLK